MPDILAEKTPNLISLDVPDEIKAEKAAILFEGRQVKVRTSGSIDRRDKGWRIGNAILYPDEDADI